MIWRIGIMSKPRGSWAAQWEPSGLDCIERAQFWEPSYGKAKGARYESRRFSRRFSKTNDLRDSLRALAEATPRTAGPSVQHALLTRFRQRRDNKRRRAYIAGIAASVAIAVGSYLALSHNGAGIRSVRPAATDQLSGFITLPYAQSGVPLEQPVIVRLDIPVSELGLMGLAVAPAGAKDNVRADVLVGQDGVARAVRLVE